MSRPKLTVVPVPTGWVVAIDGDTDRKKVHPSQALAEAAKTRWDRIYKNSERADVET